MDVLFDKKKMKELCSSSSKLQKKYSSRMAKLIRQRLDDIRAARSMEELTYLPGRFHTLTGDRKGQWAADLVHPQRLILEPIVPKDAETPDGVDWSLVTEVVVIEIVDYH